MPYADIFIGLLVIVLAVQGWLKGFVLEFFTFAGLLLGAVLGSLVNGWISKPIAHALGAPLPVIQLIVFLVVFLLVAFACGAIGSWLNKKSEDKGVDHVNQTLGVVMGFGKGLLLSGVLLMMVASVVGTKDVVRGTYIAKTVLTWTRKLLHTFDSMM